MSAKKAVQRSMGSQKSGSLERTLLSNLRVTLSMARLVEISATDMDKLLPAITDLVPKWSARVFFNKRSILVIRWLG